VDLWGAPASSAVNRGTIRAAAVSDSELSTARGIYLWGGPEGHVANEGDIDSVAVSDSNQAIAYGVCLQGGQVENSGRISATAQSGADQSLAFGIWAANGGNALRIDNNGEILAEASGSAMNAAYGIWADSRALITVINRGRIEALADDYAVGVLLTGGPAVLINNGLIRGAYASVYSLYDTELVLGSGSDLVGSVELWGDNDALLLTGNGSEDEQFLDVESLTMAGENWTLSGDSAFDTITVETGRLAIDGAIGGDTTVAVGAILAGNGALSGTLVSHGMLAPGASVGHLTIDGDVSLTGEGTLEIEVGDGLADLLTVTGTAELAGTLQVLPDGYAASGRYTFLKAGTLLGAFDSLGSVAVLDVTLDDGTAGSLILDVTRNSYRSLGTAHSRGLAAALDGLRPQVTGDLGAVLDSLDLSVSRSDLNNALTDLTPRIHGLAGSVLISGAQNRLADLRRHVRDIVPSQRLENNPTGKTAAWAEVLAQHSRWGRDSGYFGARENLYGLLLGVERTAASGLTLGAAAAVTESRLEARDAADDADLDSQQGYLYAAWRNPRRAGGFHAHATLGGGLCQVEADRVLAFVGRTTRSEHDGYLLGASLGGGYALPLGGWTLDPTVGLSYAHVREDGFRESGADGADLRIAARDNDSLQGLLGLSLGRSMQLGGLELEPTVRAEWRHEFDRQPEDVRARLAGGGDRFATPGRDLAGDSLLLGAALQARWGASLLAGLVYDCDLQSHGATAHALRLRLSVAF
jgi:outer membrane autotransporter protein